MYYLAKLVRRENTVRLTIDNYTIIFIQSCIIVINGSNNRQRTYDNDKALELCLLVLNYELPRSPAEDNIYRIVLNNKLIKLVNELKQVSCNDYIY